MTFGKFARKKKRDTLGIDDSEFTSYQLLLSYHIFIIKTIIFI